MQNEDLIYSYSTEQAIADGVLYHFAAIRPGLWCLTAAALQLAEQKLASDGSGRTLEQALHGLFSDALAFIRQNKAAVLEQAAAGGLPLFTSEFAAHMAGNLTGADLWIGGNETGGFTIMLPSDY
jgi:hypothetical protein